MVCYAGKRNPNFDAKTLHTKLMRCYRFIRRQRFAIGRISYIGQKLPDNIENLKISFITEVINKTLNIKIYYHIKINTKNFKVLKI